MHTCLHTVQTHKLYKRTVRFLPVPTVFGSLIFSFARGEEVVDWDPPEGLSMARRSPSGLVEGLRRKAVEIIQ